ncbi:ABC transporter ATP-binding protein [Candidatus Dependentiae bacterium]
MNTSSLIVEGLGRNFWQGDKSLNVLKNINAEFIQGKSYAIVGVSGSGKSTLMHLLGGLDVPTCGKVLFNEQNIFKLKQAQKNNFLNKKLGFIFQFHYLVKELTVLENIILMGLINDEDKQKSEERAIKLLQKVGLEDKINQFPTQLSGGEQQRVSVLRAIFNKPAFLLADEPTGDLDAVNAQGIVNLLLDYQRGWNTGLILCSHDVQVYNKMEHIFRLQDGVLVQEK